MRDRVNGLPLISQNHSQVVMRRDVIRLEDKAPFQMCDGIVDSTLRCQRDPQFAVYLGAVRI
jgi:hypothetical protein